VGMASNEMNRELKTVAETARVLQIPITPEPFVDATRAADWLGITSRRVLEMARAGQIPAYPLGTGSRKTWRFRLQEISTAIVRKR
jgi:hypothetical protein